MKKIHRPACFLLLLALAAARVAVAQGPRSGVITYEGMQKLDPSQFKIIRNGDVVQAGSADAPELPDAMTFALKLTFAGQFAREDTENNGPVIRRFEGSPGGPGGPPRGTVQLPPPFREKKYLDLAARKCIRVLEVPQDSLTRRYQAESDVPPPAGWQEGGKTRKIAGYTCRKATCPWKGDTYTIWYTTDLSFTYSPIAALTPPQGVVLQ
ncbi:MAG TPA: hypothetical protein VF646_01880, partial [Cytophagales bacterium]